MGRWPKGKSRHERERGVVEKGRARGHRGREQREEEENKGRSGSRSSRLGVALGIDHSQRIKWPPRSLSLALLSCSGGRQKTVHRNGLQEVQRERHQSDVLCVRADRGVPNSEGTRRAEQR